MSGTIIKGITGATLGATSSCPPWRLRFQHVNAIIPPTAFHANQTHFPHCFSGRDRGRGGDPGGSTPQAGSAGVCAVAASGGRVPVRQLWLGAQDEQRGVAAAGASRSRVLSLYPGGQIRLLARP